MFGISTSWTSGAGQVIIYAGVLVLALWILSKIDLPTGGDTPNKKGKEGNK